MFKLSSHWKIVLIVTIFNLLGEFAFRGFQKVMASGLFFFYLFITYFTFAIVLEYHIVEKKINDIGLCVLAFVMLFWWQILFPLAIFAPPRILGINWMVFIFVNILMWPTIQAVLFFYLAQRLVKRKTEETFVSKKVYILAIAVFSIVTLILHAIYKFIGLTNVVGYVVVIIELLATIFIYRKKTGTALFQVADALPSTILDILGIIVFVVLFISAFFIPINSIAYHNIHVFNQNSFKLVLTTSTLGSLVLIVYRFITKKQIPV